MSVYQLYHVGYPTRHCSKPIRSDITHHTTANRDEAENISAYIGKFFFPLPLEKNFCMEFLDRSITCELVHTPLIEEHKAFLKG